MTAHGVRSPTETLACLIIDDPLLRPKYGCLDYEELLREMRAHNFFTEIAFIPWNYRRSDPKTVRLLADNPDYYALCAHGCNHTGNEFGGSDYHELSGLSYAALWRMEEHQRLTGLPYDPVMAFPQSQFSSVAMRALRDQGYVAAFNSILRATDGEEPPVIERRRPATAMYSGLPLFLRRCPEDRSQFVQDIADGRPILVVGHHGLFRKGYAAITDLVDWVNTLGNIRWTSLLNIAERYSGDRVATARHLAAPPASFMRFNARVALRRLLSEVRDNHVETSDLLTKAYRIVRPGAGT